MQVKRIKINYIINIIIDMGISYFNINENELVLYLFLYIYIYIFFFFNKIQKI